MMNSLKIERMISYSLHGKNLKLRLTLCKGTMNCLLEIDSIIVRLD